MKWAIFAIGAALAGSSANAAEMAPHWSGENLAVLERWTSLAPLDALPILSRSALDQAIAAGDPPSIDREATNIAIRLAQMHLLGSASAGTRRGWNIEDTDRAIDLQGELEGSLESGTLDAFYASLMPRNPQYAALRNAYSQESNPAARKTIALNMERWRWMPRSLGDEHVIVNVAAFEASLWREGRLVRTWKVIVGKRSTPTPVFSATITGVTFNPWWEVPASIVRESVGALVRNSPNTAAARGYVWGGGRYRQRPGPNNALGQMKLVMPNPYSVYMHDTPNKELFAKDVRAFSHGCIRTGDALSYAAALLDGAESLGSIGAIVASGETTTVDLPRPVPVYITYFTAFADGEGDTRIQPDIYGRDARD